MSGFGEALAGSISWSATITTEVELVSRLRGRPFGNDPTPGMVVAKGTCYTLGTARNAGGSEDTILAAAVAPHPGAGARASMRWPAKNMADSAGYRVGWRRAVG